MGSEADMTVNVSYGTNRWTRCAEDEVEILECGEDFVAYHRPSGKTHLLNESSYRLITVVLDGQPTFNEIADQCVSHEDAPDSLELLDHLVIMLENLEKLGLVERL